jgi:hypothetical protein
MSINAVTISQLVMVCAHFKEMREGGITENLAIRLLELLADCYAKYLVVGSVTPNHIKQVKLRSISAQSFIENNPDTKPKGTLVVEHGTPRRAFARMVYNLYLSQELNESRMNDLVHRYWRLAVITVDEDARLNKIARSRAFDSPEERWKAAGIEFYNGV